MKKFAAFTIAILLMLALCACGLNPFSQGSQFSQSVEVTPVPVSSPPAGGFVPDPGYSQARNWDEACLQFGRGMPDIFVKGVRISVNDHGDISTSDWSRAHVQTIVRGALGGVWYKGWLYYVKDNSVYKIKADGTGQALVKQGDQQVNRRVRMGQGSGSLLSYSDFGHYANSIGSIYCAGGMLFFIVEDAVRNGTALYRCSLEGGEAQKVADQVSSLDYAASGKLYFSLDDQITVYDIQSGQSAQFAPMEQNGFAQRMWWDDRVISIVDTGMENNITARMKKLDATQSTSNIPWSSSISTMSPSDQIARLDQWLIYFSFNNANPGGYPGSGIAAYDMASGKTYILGSLEPWLSGNEIVSTSEGVLIRATEDSVNQEYFYRLVLQDGKFSMVPTVESAPMWD